MRRVATGAIHDVGLDVVAERPIESRARGWVTGGAKIGGRFGQQIGPRRRVVNRMTRCARDRFPGMDIKKSVAVRGIFLVTVETEGGRALRC